VINHQFINKYCKHLPESGAKAHEDLVMMFRSLAIMIVSAVMDCDLLTYCRNHNSFKKLFNFQNDRLFPDYAAIQSFCQQLGIIGFGEFLSSLMRELCEQQHDVLRERRTMAKYAADELGSWSTKGDLAPGAVFRKITQNFASGLNFSRMRGSKPGSAELHSGAGGGLIPVRRIE
jgi:hypothetical protein